ncbi:sialidase family protein [Halocatena pleomorpha]|uniref:Photosynthesis system II assembly factor Ycf48/Hcf136-like domain-containing protein n=1 Tax=Halocatena pleomorpha TaxID=1785090 RepID=A0A3P3RD55_9EURY|nr:hypothetical protein [Halocatena pleomorpha]RRJ31437.1 hypothetical protein EIK79_06890 [Halocatena pleomorpha]
MTSSKDSVPRGFFAYYRVYARSGIHAASAAALTALIGLASYTGNNRFILLAIAVYVLPPVFLYLTAEGENVPTVVSDETSDSAEPATNGESTIQTPSTAADDAATGEPDSETEPDWIEADTPTEESLLSVVSTHNGAYAVGEGGVVLHRTGEEWSVALEHGPTANSNPLRGVDATTDGNTAWFAGDSGVLGRYKNGRLTDHSAPQGQTSTWEDIAVTGMTGEEWIHLVNGSGELLRGEFGDGSVSWGTIEKPGSGSSISNVSFVDDNRGHICDTNQCVYETTNGGESYDKIGIEDANATFTGVAATGSTVVVAGDDGSVFRYDGAVWTRLHAGSALSAIDLSEETGLATGDKGAVYERTEGGWEVIETPTDANLYAISIGTGDSDWIIDVAVGTDGTVIERRR